VEDFEIGLEKDGMQGKEGSDRCKKEVKREGKRPRYSKSKPLLFKMTAVHHLVESRS
jgi:hypothetical protein